MVTNGRSALDRSGRDSSCTRSDAVKRHLDPPQRLFTPSSLYSQLARVHSPIPSACVTHPAKLILAGLATSLSDLIICLAKTEVIGDKSSRSNCNMY